MYKRKTDRDDARRELQRILLDEEADDPTAPPNALLSSTAYYILPEFSNLVPRLRTIVAAHSDRNLRIRAAEALVLWGEPSGNSLAMLIDFLSSNFRREERIAAIQALGHIGPPAACAIQPLVQLLSDGDAEIRSTSLQSLLLIRPEPDPAGRLVDFLFKQELDANEAIRLLVAMGRPVVKQLTQKLELERNEDRHLAINALSQIGWAPPDAIATILASFQFEYCWNSLLDRGRLFAPDRRMESFFWFDQPEVAMAHAIHHPEVLVRRPVTSMLAHWYAPQQADLLPALLSSAQDVDHEVRQNSVRSLIRWAHREPSHWEPILPLLLQAVRDSSVLVRRNVLENLYLMKERPSDRDALLEVLSDVDPDDRLRSDADTERRALALDFDARIQDLIDAVKTSVELDESAVSHLRRLGPAARAAMPCLVARLGQETDSRYRSRLGYAIAAINPQLAIIRDLLDDDDPEVRFLTLAGLQSSGQPLDELKPLILIRRSDDDASVRHEAATLLWSLDQDVAPYLRVLVDIMQQQPLYTCKVRVLFNGAPLDCLRDDCWPEVTDELLKLAHSNTAAIAQIALILEEDKRQSLHMLRLNWELFHNVSIVSDVARGLGGDFHHCIASAELLHRIGCQATAAVPELRGQLGADYYLYRLHALQVLQQIGPAAEMALGDVVHVLNWGTTNAANDEEGFCEDAVRAEAASTIGCIVPELSDLVPILKLIAGNPYVRSTLARVAETDSVEVVKSMLLALAKRHSIAPSMTNTTDSKQQPTVCAMDVEELVRTLQDEQSAHRNGAALALANLGPAAAMAIPHLAFLLSESQSTALRDTVIVALGRFGAAAVAPLQELIGHSDWIVRLEAAEALHRTEAVPEFELPSILALLDNVDGSDPMCHQRQLAPVTFRRILNQIFNLVNSPLSEHILSDASRRLLGPFSMLIQARGWHLRDCAIGNLGRFGRKAEPLVPLVLDALHDSDWLVRQAALYTIEKIATPTTEVIAALQRTSNDPFDAVRDLAISIVQEWGPLVSD